MMTMTVVVLTLFSLYADFSVRMEIINRVHQIPLLAKLGTKRNPQILEIHD
jgi:hypothetical protein